MKRVVFVSSSGGHLTEILKLKDLFSEYDYLLVTEKTKLTLELSNQYKMEFLEYGPNKNLFKYVLIILYNILLCLKILIKFKPETIVTTGAQIGGIMCLIGKIFRCKVIYIESLAKTRTLSRTGEFVYKFADKFYVQWESLTDVYDRAFYLGRLM